MKLSEVDFLAQLEEKANEQRKLVKTEILPVWAKGVGEWLVVNPWRVIVPAAVIIYLIFRIIIGARMREIILAMFGGY